MNRFVFACILATAFGPTGSAAPLSPEQVNAWRADLDVLTEDFLNQELTLIGEKRVAFESAVAQLRNDLPRLSRSQVIVRACQAVAIAGNGHTRAYGLFAADLCRRLPIRAWWFRDGLYIVRARPEYKDIVGARVVAIEGHSIENVAKSVATTSYGTPGRHRYMDLPFLFSPEFLSGLGLMNEPGPVTVEFVTEGGVTLKRIIEPEAPEVQGWQFQEWQHLSPLTKNGSGAWVHVLDDKRDALPLYLRHPDTVFWSEELSEEGVLYLHYSRSDTPEASVGNLRADLPAQLQQKKIRRVVVDMRFNVGGDYTIMRSVFRKIVAEEKALRPGGLFVITGPTTFSAGISNTTYMKQEANARIAGETVGDDLDFWAEGAMVTLPNSKIRVGTNDGFHNYSKQPLTEYQKEHLHTDLDVDTLEPDVPVWATFAEYKAGRDPVLEAVLEEKRP